MATVITNKGLALLAKLTQGNTLEITSAKTGAGTVDASLLQQQTAVTNLKQTMTIKSINYPEDGKCVLVLSVTNDGVASGYTIMQVGIYAQDPDEGELLFSIWQIDSGSGINIPSEAVLPGYNAEMNYYIKYDQADSVNVNVDPSNTVSQAAMEAYVNKEAKSVVDAHTANKNNPHNVSASQLGLAKVATSGSYNDLSNKPTIPSTLPANGGNADTVDGKHASDFATSGHTHDVSKIAGAVSLVDLPNMHVWRKYSEDPDQYELGGAKSTLIAIKNSNGVYNDIYYSSTVDVSDGVVSLIDPSVLTGFENNSSDETEIRVLAGKYVKGYDGNIYLVPDTLATSTATNYVVGGTYYLQVIGVKSVTVANIEFVYVADKNKGTYPTDGKHTDGCWYEYHKQLAEDPEPAITYGTADLEAGVSALATGKLYIVYE